MSNDIEDERDRNNTQLREEIRRLKAEMNERALRKWCVEQAIYTKCEYGEVVRVAGDIAKYVRGKK